MERVVQVVAAGRPSYENLAAGIIPTPAAYLSHGRSLIFLRENRQPLNSIQDRKGGDSVGAGRAQVGLRPICRADMQLSTPSPTIKCWSLGVTIQLDGRAGGDAEHAPFDLLPSDDSRVR